MTTSGATLARGSWWSWTTDQGWTEHYTPRPGIDVCFHNQCPWCFLRVRHGCSAREAWEGYVQAFNRFVQSQPATHHEAELLYLAWSEIVHLGTVLANWHPRDGYRTREISNRIVLLPQDDRFPPYDPRQIPETQMWLPHARLPAPSTPPELVEEDPRRFVENTVAAEDRSKRKRSNKKQPSGATALPPADVTVRYLYWAGNQKEWQPYDAENQQIINQNRAMNRLQFHVTVDGRWTYFIDLEEMEQCPTSHGHQTRPIKWESL